VSEAAANQAIEAERAVRKQGAEDFFNAEGAVWNKPEAPFIFLSLPTFHVSKLTG
jgi:hypothetical protein